MLDAEIKDLSQNNPKKLRMLRKDIGMIFKFCLNGKKKCIRKCCNAFKNAL